MSDCKPKPTPCILGFETTTNDDSKELTDPKLYRAIVGSLMYVMTGTRPDLCYVVTISKNVKTNTSRFRCSQTCFKIYLSGTQKLGSTFKKSVSPLNLEGFCDSDWGASTTDRRSITGYNFQLSSVGPLISWESRKQQTVALSTCEAEYSIG